MLKVGFYEKNITPPLGCDIPGFFYLVLQMMCWRICMQEQLLLTTEKRK